MVKGGSNIQDLAVCDLMSIVRNMVLGNEPRKRFGPLRIYHAKKADRVTADALATLGVDLRRRLSDPAATLSGGQKQAVAIARAIVYGSRCLILDEPTPLPSPSARPSRCSLRSGARGTPARPSS